MRSNKASFPARLLISVILVYRNSLSKLLLHSCRFVPTCSEFAMEAVQRHGALRGLGLTARRFWLCRPLGKHGYDPVP